MREQIEIILRTTILMFCYENDWNIDRPRKHCLKDNYQLFSSLPRSQCLCPGERADDAAQVHKSPSLSQMSQFSCAGSPTTPSLAQPTHSGPALYSSCGWCPQHLRAICTGSHGGSHALPPTKESGFPFSPSCTFNWDPAHLSNLQMNLLQ